VNKRRRGGETACLKGGEKRRKNEEGEPFSDRIGKKRSKMRPRIRRKK